MDDYARFIETENDLPSSVHGEMTILGAMMVESVAVHEATIRLVADDFSLDSHRRIYAAMVELHREGSPVDIVTVSAELKKRKELDSIGGTAYLASLSEGLPRKLSVESYVRIVRDKSLLRSILVLSDATSAACRDGAIEAIEIANHATSRLSEIIETGSTKEGMVSASEMADAARERLNRTSSGDEVIPTGIPGLDARTGGGMRPGELWIVGASPSRGKTTLARQIVKNIIWRDEACYVHSGEMSKESWFDITACLLEGIPAWKVREPHLMNVTERENMARGIRALEKLPLHITDDADLHMDEFIWNATRCIQIHGMRVSALDYAQIMKAPGKDERQQVSYVAHRYRKFLKDTGTVGILLSQMARPSERLLNQKPTVFQLRESGALEEAAHVVLLPYRPIDTDTKDFTGEDELIIGKSRWSALGSVPVTLNGEFLRFDPRMVTT